MKSITIIFIMLKIMYGIVRRNQKVLWLIAIGGFAVVGSFLLANSRAATNLVSLQPDSGTITAPAQRLSDSTASGGSAVKFVQSVTPPPTGSVSFVADGETGNASQWCHVHSAVDVLPLVTSPVRDGRYAFKSEVRDGSLIYSTERSEYANGPELCGKDTYINGEENYTALSVYPASNYPKFSHWSLVAQFKGPHTGTPPMQISLQNDTFSVTGSGRVSPRPTWPIAAVQRGAWNDFVLHAKWSPDPKVGWFELYYNGKLVIPKTMTATMYLDNGTATPLFLSVGQYRDTSPTTGTATLYFDAVKVGSTLSSVMPPAR